MENFKQIVYRQSDKALMIIPQNDNIQVVPRFVNELTELQQVSFNELETFCLTQKDPLLYTVYTTDVNRLDIQGEDNEVICLNVSEMSPEDKAIVDKVGVICTELLNS
ncbi:MAG: hypothetical protein WCH21_08175 [Bacteroidota bacterium]